MSYQYIHVRQKYFNPFLVYINTDTRFLFTRIHQFHMMMHLIYETFQYLHLNAFTACVLPSIPIITVRSLLAMVYRRLTHKQPIWWRRSLRQPLYKYCFVLETQGETPPRRRFECADIPYFTFSIKQMYLQRNVPSFKRTFFTSFIQNIWPQSDM